LSNADAAEFHKLLARRFNRTGAATVNVDHVSPGSPHKESKAIGAQHKGAGIDGAEFYFDLKVPLAQALDGDPVVGLAQIRVGKDRPGGVRGRSEGQKAFGELSITAYPDGHLEYEIRPMTPAADWRPTVIMERVSIYIEEHDGANTGAIRREVTGRGEWIDKGLAALIPEHVRVEAVGSEHRHYSVKPFRQPQSHASGEKPRMFSADDEGLTAHGGGLE
jgi:hypothetical protein